MEQVTRKQWIIGGIIGFLVLLIITNPSVETHRAKVKELVTSNVAEELKGNPFASVANILLDAVVNSIITRDDYVVFSLTKATYEGKEKVIGIGALGFVQLDVNKDNLELLK